MLQTSQDLLLISLSLAVIWLTVFLCVVLYYLAMLLKEGYKIFEGWRKRMTRIDEILDLIKEKIGRTTSSLVLIAEGVKQAIEFLAKRQGEKRERKEEKESKKKKN